MKKWEPGALAVIVVAAHARNNGRIVQLVERFGFDGLGAVWLVFDGHMFDGNSIVNGEQVSFSAQKLAIHQWKMRLIDDKEDVFTDSEGISYVKEKVTP